MSVSYVSMAYHALDILCLSTVCVCSSFFWHRFCQVLKSRFLPCLSFHFLFISVTSSTVTCWPLSHFATLIRSNCFLFIPSDCLCASNLCVNFSWMSYFSLSLYPPLPLILFFLSNYTAIFHVPFLFHLFISHSRSFT